MFFPEFHRWFVEEKSDTMIRCMIIDARKKAGMGCNPDHFYTNTCELMNSTIKNRTDFKMNDVRPFVEKMLQLTQAQKNLRKEVIRNDRWRFRAEYKHFEVDLDKWFSMSVKSQKQHLNVVCSEPLGFVPDDNSAINESDTTNTSTDELAVTFTELINPYRITTNALEDIWRKGKHLVLMPGLVCPVPGQNDSNNRIIASLNEPHYIVEKNGKFNCSGKCPRFGAYKICQHTVAAAQNCGLLERFCNWWKSHKAEANVDALAMMDLPKGARQKGGLSKRGWKGGQKGPVSSTVVPTNRIASCEAPTSSCANTLSDLSQMSSSSYNSFHHSFNHFNQVLTPSYNYPQWNNQLHLSPQFVPHGVAPFYLKMLTRQIKVCAGCRFGFNNELSVPEPPYNMCIAHEEPYVISPQSSTKFTKKNTSSLPCKR